MFVSTRLFVLGVCCIVFVVQLFGHTSVVSLVFVVSSVCCI